MKKKIAASIFVGSLLFGGISVGAEEVANTSSKTEVKGIYKVVNSQLKAQSEKNKQQLQALFAEIKQIKTRVQSVLAEVKPLQAGTKELIAKLKVAKEKKDKVQVKVLKEAIATKQQAVKTKMSSIQPDLNRLKELQTELKEIQAQIKPIQQQNKAKYALIKQLKQEIQSTKLQAKESKQQGDVEAANEKLAEIASLAEQIRTLKKEILAQKILIGELLAK